TAGENFPWLDKKKIRGPRTNIDEQRTSAQVAVVMAKRVVESHRRQIDNRRPQARFLDRAINFVEQVHLDGDKNHLNRFARASADELIIPNHFVDRKWDVLLCLEGDDPLNFFLVDRR